LFGCGYAALSSITIHEYLLCPRFAALDERLAQISGSGQRIWSAGLQRLQPAGAFPITQRFDNASASASITVLRLTEPRCFALDHFPLLLRGSRWSLITSAITLTPLI